MGIVRRRANMRCCIEYGPCCCELADLCAHAALEESDVSDDLWGVMLVTAWTEREVVMIWEEREVVMIWGLGVTLALSGGW